MSDVEELRDEVGLVGFVDADQEQAGSVALRQQKNVLEDLLAEQADVQLVGDVADEFDEEVPVVKLGQLAGSTSSLLGEARLVDDDLLEHVLRYLIPIHLWAKVCAVVLVLDI